MNGLSLIDGPDKFSFRHTLKSDQSDYLLMQTNLLLSTGAITVVVTLSCNINDANEG